MPIYPFAKEGVSSILRIIAIALTIIEQLYDEVSVPVIDTIRRL
jgi:hypothetical protein